MKSVLATWFLLFGLLLQSVAWALPAQRTGQAERLGHEVAHAIDHGHHQHHGSHDETDHDDLDAALPTDSAPDDVQHGPHHSHASEGVQFQGLPVAAALRAPALPRSAPRVGTSVQPPSADLAGLLRPPQPRV